MTNWCEIFDAVRLPDERGDCDPGQIRIDRAADVPAAVAKARQRKRRAPGAVHPETVFAFDTTAPEVRE